MFRRDSMVDKVSDDIGKDSIKPSTSKFTESTQQLSKSDKATKSSDKKDDDDDSRSSTLVPSSQSSVNLLSI